MFVFVCDGPCKLQCSGVCLRRSSLLTLPTYTLSCAYTCVYFFCLRTGIYDYDTSELMMFARLILKTEGANIGVKSSLRLVLAELP